jgi:hypothetical protein
VTRTTPPNDPPNDGIVIHIDEWSKPRASGVGRTARSRPGTGIDDPADSGEPVPGSDEWWNKALTAFEAYTELGAVDGNASVAAQDDGEKETGVRVSRAPCQSSGPARLPSSSRRRPHTPGGHK